jgi:hypothetical protein
MATGLPTSTTIEIEFVAGTWTDVTALVNVGAGSITRKVGRSTQLDTISAGSLTFTLDNPVGNFTPDNPLSIYYPNVVEGKRVRWKVTQGATTYTRFTGWVTQWVPEISGLSASSVQVVATDALGHLSTRQVWGLPETELRYDSPLVYYTLDHPSDSYYVPFYSAVGGPSLRYHKAPVGGSLSLSDGVGAPYDDLTCPTWTMDTNSSPYLYATNVNTSDLSTFSIELLAKMVVDTTPGSNDLGLLKLGDLSIYYNYGTGELVVVDGSTIRLSYAVDLFDAQHLISVTSSSSGSSLYIDGSSVDTGSAFTTIPKGRALNVGVAYEPGWVYYNGEISHVAVYDKELSSAAIAFHASAVDAYYGETIATALNAVARWSGVSITNEGSGSPQLVDAIDVKDKKALDALTYISSGDGGVLYDDGSGLYARVGSALKSGTVKLSLDVEADLDDSVTLTRSITEDVAGATASSYSQSATYVDADQATSIGTFATIEVPNLALTDLEAIASNIVSVSNNHRLSAGQAAFDLANANTDKYADTLTMKIGDRVRLTNLISTQFGRTYLDTYVQAWSESLNAQGYKFVFDLDAADVPSEAKFDDSTYGRFAAGDGVLTLTSLITDDATSISVSSSGLPLTVTAGSYPMDLDINGERVTVASAPASSTSPQTLTVTRGVAPSIARAHTAGESVEIYMAGKFAL